MAISHVATGVRTSGNAGTTTTAVARPTTGNTAGNITLVGRAIKPETATGTPETGWTALSDVTGGTGTTGVDVGLTRIVVDYQQLVGGESGSVTFDQASTPNAVASCMITYARTGEAWAVATVGGNDATHAVGRTVTGSVYSVGIGGLRAGDVIVAFVASDTDDATAWTSPAITATGMTITTTQRLATGGVTQNNDCGISIIEGAVTAGTQASVAPTITLSGGPANCGPVAFVRLREPAPTITQAAYRFYADGTETGSTALEAQDTAVTVDTSGGDANLGLRVRIQSTGADPVLPGSDWQLQWEKNTSGTWTNVGTGAVVGYASSDLTDQAATTNRLGAGSSGTFVPGTVSEDGLVDNEAWTVGNYTELLYSVTLKQADLAPTDTLRFRVLRDGVTTGVTYTAVPTVTIGSAGPATINGIAVASFAIDATATGTVVAEVVTGTAVSSFALDVTATGTAVAPGAIVTGIASTSVAVAAVATGTVVAEVVTGTATASLAINVAATGTVVAEVITGTAVASFAITAAAIGTVVAEVVSGTAVSSVALTSTTTGTRVVGGTSAVGLALTVTASGTVVAEVVSGTAITSVAITAVATGTRVVYGTTAVPVALTVTAVGVIGGITTGTASSRLAVSVVAVGTRVVRGTSVVPVAFATVAVGTIVGAPITGVAASSVTIVVVAVGTIETGVVGQWNGQTVTAMQWGSQPVEAFTLT